MWKAEVLYPDAVENLTPKLLDDRGRLRVVPAGVLAPTSDAARMLFGVRHAAYLLPTEELVQELAAIIAGRTVLEIGAGNGVLSQALGIRATDNRQQMWPDIRATYEMLRQPVIDYGPDVEPLDAHAAIERYRPQVVLACWVTHRFDPQWPAAGGSATGVDEAWVIGQCEEYVFVGNDSVHAPKPIWSLPHRKASSPCVFSRSAHAGDFIARWTRSAIRPGPAR